MYQDHDMFNTGEKQVDIYVHTVYTKLPENDDNNENDNAYDPYELKNKAVETINMFDQFCTFSIRNSVL